MIGGRGFLRFVLIAITKMDILYMFYHFQDPIKVIRRYEGYHYTRLESYYIIFYFETDWSRIRPLPSTTLTCEEKNYCFTLPLGVLQTAQTNETCEVKLESCHQAHGALKDENLDVSKGHIAS